MAGRSPISVLLLISLDQASTAGIDEHGSVNRPPSPLVGQTRIITWAVLIAAQSLYAEEPDIYQASTHPLLRV
jgi:hypothetical protein